MDVDTNAKPESSRFVGILYGGGSFALWGILPLYWKFLKQVPANEILAHRILWSFVFVAALLFLSKRWASLMVTIRNKKKLSLILLCSILIAMNWFIYIWAVNSNHIVESSMGYYINPLMSVLLGMVILKERLDVFQTLALLLASAGVVITTIHYGKIPWISLLLAITFALYGLFKKLVDVDSITGLAVETAILTPVALTFLSFKQIQGTAALGHISLQHTVLLLLAGVATATPLLWFAKGARRLELSTIGFLQYLSPSISLLLGIFVYKEHFTSGHLLSFGFIWGGLVLYSLSRTNLSKKLPLLLIKPVNPSGK